MPVAKAVPEGGEHWMEGTPALSATVGASQVADAEGTPEATSTLTAGGQVIVGNCRSVNCQKNREMKIHPFNKMKKVSLPSGITKGQMICQGG